MKQPITPAMVCPSKQHFANDPQDDPGTVDDYPCDMCGELTSEEEQHEYVSYNGQHIGWYCPDCYEEVLGEG